MCNMRDRFIGCAIFRFFRKVMIFFFSLFYLSTSSVSALVVSPMMASEGDSSYSILIDKSDYQLSLFLGDELVKNYSIGIGKNSGDKQRPGDMRTPIGVFRVDGMIDARSWTHDFGDGKGEIVGAYGPWFISLATPWEGIGIHGTHDPHSIGTRVSEGCVRMFNEDVEELKEYLFLGALVEIRE